MDPKMSTLTGPNLFGGSKYGSKPFHFNWPQFFFGRGKYGSKHFDLNWPIFFAKE